MGPDESLLKNGEIMYCSDNSIDFEQFPIPVLDFSVLEHNLEEYIIGIDLAKGLDTTIYGYFKLPRKKISHSKKISHKKFKKWLMSKGINRNQTESLCNMIRICNGSISYIDVYNECFLFPSYFNVFGCILYKILKGA